MGICGGEAVGRGYRVPAPIDCLATAQRGRYPQSRPKTSCSGTMSNLHEMTNYLAAVPETRFAKLIGGAHLSVDLQRCLFRESRSTRGARSCRLQVLRRGRDGMEKHSLLYWISPMKTESRAAMSPYVVGKLGAESSFTASSIEKQSAALNLPWAAKYLEKG